VRKTYPTDLSEAEWECIEPHLPTPRAAGRPRRHSLREILDAIFYIVRSGCAWRLLAHELPPWKTIHHYFRIWRMDGTWEQLHTALPNRLGVRLKRDPQPSAAIVDSQSVKTTGVGGAPQRGFDLHCDKPMLMELARRALAGEEIDTAIELAGVTLGVNLFRSGTIPVRSLAS
jgi:putative transposase